MQLYTREDLLKRAWVADARQADLMIDAIASSYNGDIDAFNCQMNTVANLLWLVEALKCTDPESIITTTFVQQITPESNEYTTTETPINRCITDENIQGIVLKIERIVGSLCGCDPSELVDDTIPDIIKYTRYNLYPIAGGPVQIISIGGIIPPPIVPEPPVIVDFNIQDFNPLDFA